MLRYLAPLIFVLSTANSWKEWSPHRRVSYQNVPVASESQVKFALESKYDDTGPGAKQPEFAYSTYKNLEDALIAYLDDPDTKLPEHERAKAINKLTQTYPTSYASSPFLKNGHYKILEKPHFRLPNHQTETHNFPVGKLFYLEDSKVGKSLDGNDLLGNYQVNKKLESFKSQKLHAVKGNPLSLAHYTRDPDIKLAHDQFDPHPKYTFSYGVNDKTTGDSKSAQESRDGGNVRGFYSFIDSDGKTRTVYYTADDQHGFRADVHKSN